MTEDSAKFKHLKDLAESWGEYPVYPNDDDPCSNGLTFRDYLIGQALSGSVQCVPDLEDIEDYEAEQIATAAILIADKVLTQLAQKRLEKTGGSKGD